MDEDYFSVSQMEDEVLAATFDFCKLFSGNAFYEFCDFFGRRGAERAFSGYKLGLAHFYAQDFLVQDILLETNSQIFYFG
jgi:hypothetical protein